jgi:hypothetical protein
MPVATVFENLEAGASIEEIMEWFDLTREQIVAVLDFAAQPCGSIQPPLMRILFDQGTPAPLIAFLIGHVVDKVRAMGWDTLPNGDLLTAAEAAGFEVLITTDKNLRYQQNLTGRLSAPRPGRC